MSAVLATHLDTTQGKAARYGTTTTSWRQERPGLWVATRGGITIGAIHLSTRDIDVPVVETFSMPAQTGTVMPTRSAEKAAPVKRLSRITSPVLRPLRTSLLNVLRYPAAP